MKALILAAGKGTRLGPLTESTPKPMLPVNGEPLLAHTVRWLVDQEITQIAINLHHAADKIRDFFGDGRSMGAAITYSYEPVLLGTAGAAKRLEPFLNERFVVVYGDVYTNVDLGRLEEFHAQALGRLEGTSGDGRPAEAITLALYQVPNPWECGLVDLDASGRVLRFVEKPPRDQVFTDLANAGLQIVEPAVLEMIPAEAEQDFGRDVLPAMLRAGLPVFGRPVAEDEFVIDIGTPAAYARAEQLARSGDRASSPRGAAAVVPSAASEGSLG